MTAGSYADPGGNGDIIGYALGLAGSFSPAGSLSGASITGLGDAYFSSGGGYQGTVLLVSGDISSLQPNLKVQVGTQYYDVLDTPTSMYGYTAWFLGTGGPIFSNGASYTITFRLL
jgi:hypothetical protein